MANRNVVETEALSAATAAPACAPLIGAALLHDPHNKGTAFSREERRRLGLEGLLPDPIYVAGKS